MVEVRLFSSICKPHLLDGDHAVCARVTRRKEIDEQAALGVGMKEKAEEFVAAGGEMYKLNFGAK